jgi:hypothetical protein
MYNVDKLIDYILFWLHGVVLVHRIFYILFLSFSTSLMKIQYFLELCPFRHITIVKKLTSSLVKPVITKEKIDTRANDKTNTMQLFSFDSANLWIYWLLKNIIFTEAEVQGGYNFFLQKSISPHVYRIKRQLLLYSISLRYFL